MLEGRLALDTRAGPVRIRRRIAKIASGSRSCIASGGSCSTSRSDGRISIEAEVPRRRAQPFQRRREASAHEDARALRRLIAAAWSWRSLSACGLQGGGAATRDGPGRREVPRFHFSRVPRRPRDAGRPGAAQGRLALAADRRPAGRRTQLRRGVEARPTSIRPKPGSDTSVSPARITTTRWSTSIARSWRTRDTRRRCRARRGVSSRSVSATWRSRASRPPSSPTPALTALHSGSKCSAFEACRTMWRRRARRRSPVGSTRRGARTSRRLPASPQSPFLYRELASVAQKQDRTLPAALQHARKADRARSGRRPHAGPDRRDPREPGRRRRGAARPLTPRLALEPNAALEARIACVCERQLLLAAMPAEFQSIEGAHASRARSSRRSSALRLDDAAAARAAADRRRHHRCASELGGAVDPVGHARRGHGGLSQSHVSAGRRRPAWRSRAAVSQVLSPDCGREAAAWRAMAERAPSVSGRLAGASAAIRLSRSRSRRAS